MGLISKSVKKSLIRISFSLVEPQPHAVDDADWEHECSGYEEAPQALTEASEDVIEPSREAG
jgi:hypothetical protein